MLGLAACGATSDTAHDTEKGSVVDSAGDSPILYSSNHGLSWQPLGSNWPAGVQGSFLAESAGFMVLATDNLGIYLTKDDGATWQQVGSTLPSTKINALHLAQGQLWVGVYQAGLFTSQDRGESWQAVTGLPDPRVQAILKTEEFLWVGTDTGLYRKRSGNTTWERVREGLQVNSLQQAETLMLVGTNQGTLVSTDAGETWTLSLEGQATHNTYLTAEGGYAMNINGEVMVTHTPTWNTWRPAQYGPKDSSYAYEMVDSGPYLILSNNHGLHRSVDLGLTWHHLQGKPNGIIFDLLSTQKGLFATIRR